MISPGSDYGKPLNTASNEIAPIYNYPVVAPKTPKLKRSEGIVHPRTGEEEMEVPNGCKGVRRFMFLTLRRCWRVSMSTPVEAEKKGEQALLSLALTTSLLAEIVLCAFIIAMVSCESKIVNVHHLHPWAHAIINFYPRQPSSQMHASSASLELCHQLLQQLSFNNLYSFAPCLCYLNLHYKNSLRSLVLPLIIQV